MTNEEIDERYHDAALEDEGEVWDDDDAGSDAWDDPELAVEDDVDVDLDEDEI